MEKMKKWLKVMKADFLEIVHWNWLKLLGHVAIIPIQLPIKKSFKWMYGFQVREKQISALCIFVSEHSAVLWIVRKNELGL